MTEVVKNYMTNYLCELAILEMAGAYDTARTFQQIKERMLSVAVNTLGTELQLNDGVYKVSGTTEECQEIVEDAWKLAQETFK